MAVKPSVDRISSSDVGGGECRPADLAARLWQLGVAVRTHLIQHRDLTRDHVRVGEAAGDTVFAIDRKVEPVITAALHQWPAEWGSLVVVAEGFGDDGLLRIGARSGEPRWRLLIDPIDGTRSLMYDKRSAWFLAAAAPDRGEAIRLSDAVAAVMVELPTSKQALSDAFVYAAGGPVSGYRTRLGSGESTTLPFAPSGATTLDNGFAQVSNFFPGTKVLASELMEHIAASVLPQREPGGAAIFDDQYICTGGQLVELMCGRDRFCCDLRPLFYDILERRLNRTVPRGLACHPYDMAGLPLAKAAGLIVTDGHGRPLDAPFDVHTPIHWCGYANESLRQRIAPVIGAWLSRHLGRDGA